MVFVDPSATIPITLTGDFCALNCPHCKGHYLRSMKPFSQIEHYVKLGYKSFLISGGLNKTGELPYNEYLERLKELKNEYNLSYNFHVGFPSKIEFLADVADVISFDFFADRKILKKIYGIEYEPTKLIQLLKDLQISAVPHITIGIDHGVITHEFDALKILKDHFKVVVLNIFIPTFGTPFENFPPPPIEKVVEVFEAANLLFDKVILGCMQPKGEYRKKLQQMVSKYVDVMVKPVSNKIYHHQGCCAFFATKGLGVFENVR
ncbi:radical SAM protein [Pseudothermotoga thermarum]|uniref:Radical SAM domain protein n=1 Tax=Pseudothermotoga thermarum DSM 5069 TaxID=688269 RepID=F7YYH2_9THEM|nr:radical SAM protein [Pseudothermotoga thermarum]AEH50997.1 Radical SAM domain protein [Pseudothermotoga thermarum DSM 5069]